MKPLLIRTDGIFPPGGYPFKDAITGKDYKGTGDTFAVRVSQIIRDRKANQRLFADPKRIDPIYVEKELSEYCCARLNGNPTYCSDPNSLNKPEVALKFEALSNRKCPHCGSDRLKPTSCPTCAKFKLTGYECLQCGNKVSV